MKIRTHFKIFGAISAVGIISLLFFSNSKPKLKPSSRITDVYTLPLPNFMFETHRRIHIVLTFKVDYNLFNGIACVDSLLRQKYDKFSVFIAFKGNTTEKYSSNFETFLRIRYERYNKIIFHDSHVEDNDTGNWQALNQFRQLNNYSQPNDIILLLDGIYFATSDDMLTKISKEFNESKKWVACMPHLSTQRRLESEQNLENNLESTREMNLSRLEKDIDDVHSNAGEVENYSNRLERSDGSKDSNSDSTIDKNASDNLKSREEGFDNELLHSYVDLNRIEVGPNQIEIDQIRLENIPTQGGIIANRVESDLNHTKDSYIELISDSNKTEIDSNQLGKSSDQMKNDLNQLNSGSDDKARSNPNDSNQVRSHLAEIELGPNRSNLPQCGSPWIFRSFLVDAALDSHVERFGNYDWLNSNVTNRGFLNEVIGLAGGNRVLSFEQSFFMFNNNSFADQAEKVYLNEIMENTNTKSMDEEIHVFMVLWKRAHVLKKTLKSLMHQQTVSKRIHLHLWNNNPAITKAVDAAIKPYLSLNRVHVTHSPINLYSYARFLNIRESMQKWPMDYVIIVDDDQRFLPNYIEDLFEERLPKVFRSWWGRKFYGKLYFQGVPSGSELVRGLRKDILEFDYAGPGGCVLDINLFDMDAVYMIPQEYMSLDDIWLSYVVGMTSGWKAKRTFVRPLSRTDDKSLGVALWHNLKYLKDSFLEDLRRSGWRV